MKNLTIGWREDSKDFTIAQRLDPASDDGDYHIKIIGKLDQKDLLKTLCFYMRSKQITEIKFKNNILTFREEK